jgi:hypothetical protein
MICARNLVITLILCVFCATSSAQASGSWEWTAAIYLWGSDVSLDLAVNGDPVLEVDAEFNNLIRKVEMAGTVHFEGQNGHWGFFTDVYYIDLAKSENVPLPDPLPGSVNASMGMTLTIFEAAAIYSPSGSTEGFSLFGGLRYLGVDQSLLLTLPLPGEPSREFGIDESFADVMFGLRYISKFSDRWGYVLRGDLATGSTDLTVNALAMLSVGFGQTQKYGAVFGYRYLGIELENTEDGVKTETEMTMSGPLAAFTIQW